MTRDWIAVYPALRDLPKFNRLSSADRGALFQVWMLAPATTPEATFRSLDYLAGLLLLDGFDGDAATRLLEAGWLDVDDDGRVLVHDWDDHQMAATKSIALAFEADRKREWRRHNRGLVSPTPPSDNTSHNNTSHNRSPGQRPDGVRTTSGRHDESPIEEGDEWATFTNEKWDPFKAAWTARGFEHPPTATQHAILWPIVDARPNDVADWVGSSKSASGYDVVKNVLERWRASQAAA